MIVTHKTPYRDGELRIGWASWDDGSMTKRSIKYAYKDASGKVSRGAPEIPFELLEDMMSLALEQREIPFWKPRQEPSSLEGASYDDLKSERRMLNGGLMQLLKLIAEMPWVDFSKQYDQIGERRDLVDAELARRVSRESA